MLAIALPVVVEAGVTLSTFDSGGQLNFANNGGYQIWGLEVAPTGEVDIFGDDLTPEQCCDDVASNNDQLTVDGAVLLDSTIDLNYVDNYKPEFGDVFTLICASDVITLDDGFHINGRYFRLIPTGDLDFPFALQAIVPEPASMAVWTLVGLAGAAGAWRMRRKNTRSERSKG